MHVTFKDASNYYTEMLAFEVVDFSGLYHIILGWPCYVKFMTIPNCTYHKIKIPRPAGVITMEAKTQWALDSEQRSIELTTILVVTIELKELCLSALPYSTSLTMPSTPGTFKAAVDAKVVQIDAADPTKTVQIGTSLSPDRKAGTSTSSGTTRTFLRGDRQKCRASLGRSPSIPSTSSPGPSLSSRSCAASIGRSARP
jgi:hypothetical protein